MKKTLRPQQSAPVKRENNGTVKGGEKGLVPCFDITGMTGLPFAGDDAE